MFRSCGRWTLHPYLSLSVVYVYSMMVPPAVADSEKAVELNPNYSK